ncbi:MAG TPA: uridine diphosphate-N-acetylglucosamine-binding protein YvcK [Pyrinomonadaceae bacterium]|nr:uridine diphosphate-N-acetylglucosamine-binding protein YvcK [Pyrinomonadaceae bacterium]
MNKFEQNGVDLVAIGGGTGLSTLLSGLKKYVGAGLDGIAVRNLSAIVAVSDDGGSSGRLRDEFQMPPPGDIRNCMVALSEDSHLLSKLFKYRFAGDGQLAGHNFGNLFLAALSGVTGDFAEAVRLSSEILASKGRIFPATVSDVRIAARLTDGSVVQGETNISKTGGTIERMYLEPEDCEPHPEAIAAISNGDILTIGPGSLYTSILPPLLVNGVVDAIAASSATKIFVCNLMTQPGETDGLTARRHLEIVRDYAPRLDFDYVMVNNRPISDIQKHLYTRDGAEQIGVHGSIDSEVIEGASVVYANLLDDGDLVRHHPERLARAVLRLESR